MELQRRNLYRTEEPPPTPGQTQAANPTIHTSLTEAMSILAQAENLCGDIRRKLTGEYPVPDEEPANCAPVYSVESLAIGLRTRLGVLQTQLDQVLERI